MNILQNIEEYFSTTFSFCAKGKMLKPCSEQREGDLIMTVYIFYYYYYLYERAKFGHWGLVVVALMKPQLSLSQAVFVCNALTGLFSFS